MTTTQAPPTLLLAERLERRLAALRARREADRRAAEQARREDQQRAFRRVTAAAREALGDLYDPSTVSLDPDELLAIATRVQVDLPGLPRISIDIRPESGSIIAYYVRGRYCSTLDAALLAAADSAEDERADPDAGPAS